MMYLIIRILVGCCLIIRVFVGNPNVNVSYGGNPNLSFPPSNSSAGRKNKNPVSVGIVVASTATVVVLMVVTVVAVIVSWKIHRVNDNEESRHSSQPEVVKSKFLTLNVIQRTKLDLTKAMECADHPFTKTCFTVEPSSANDVESLEVDKDCLSEAFKIESSSTSSVPKSDSLVHYFGTTPSGDDEQALDRATHLFHNALMV
ncbi:hypothetical protein L1987_79799 [Smallanthus sonchifolius]|uniref:Uncharacterized protein n=1 Tax=Smallanthus sonchifolius TaxID=185202 RepID=A0ACB8YLJ0_9ASTR|nr:hypothetical protein L1987_79799 [Smallanthus sonchifolius]